jgi:hypothetical protein
MDWLVSNVLFSRPKETIDTCSSSSANNQPSSTSNTSSSQSTKLILNKYQSQELPCSQHECLCTPVMIENHVDMLEIPPPYDSSKSNTPRRTNSTPSYTQQFVNKLRDTKSKLGYQQEHTKPIVDRKSLSQGMKLVEIAVEEFESGNEAIGLDVYLSGLDKIIMSLPSKFILKEIISL